MYLYRDLLAWELQTSLDSARTLIAEILVSCDGLGGKGLIVDIERVTGVLSTRRLKSANNETIN